MFFIRVLAVNKKKNILKKTILLLVIIFSFEYAQSQSIIRLLNGSDMFIITRCYKDSLIFRYENYEITTFPSRQSVGENIRIKDSTNQIRFINNDWASYFYGVIDNKLIIDIGTGSVRKFRIYELSNLEMEFSSSYVGKIKTKNGIISFFCPIKLSEEESLIIDCPEKENILKHRGTVGFVERREYNIVTDELIKTGKINCRYVE